MLFGERLSQLRKEAHIKAEELATFIGVKKRMVFLYEKNEAKPSFDVLMRIADCFCVSLDYLVGRSNEQRREEFSQARRILHKYAETPIPVYRRFLMEKWEKPPEP